MSEINELTTDEVMEHLEEFQNKLVNMKINHTVSPLENPHLIKDTRRVVARLKTELRKRELEAKK